MDVEADATGDRNLCWGATMGDAAYEAFPDNWVRVLADSCADGVWNILGEGCAADELPVTPELVARIRAWQADYDARFDLDEDVTSAEIGAFSAEGAQIARELKRQLPGWTVVYFDEARFRHGDLRPRYEYEIV
jgi:hypothetical protein